jgi:branched-subunit amino acid aminotransferase/4-amino-4-deoxychorismate lyase
LELISKKNNYHGQQVQNLISTGKFQAWSISFYSSFPSRLWAKHWYDTVHQTTRFAEYHTNPIYKILQGNDLELFRESLPFYQMLQRKAIGHDPLNPGSSLPYQPTTCSPNESKTITDHGMTVSLGQSRLADSRNENIIVWIGNGLVPRELAKISVFDSAVQGGDAVWEGIRVYRNKVFKLDEHLSRLFDSAKAMAFQGIPSIEFIKEAIFKTLSANGMKDNAHMRLTLTRGPKITSSMNPQFNIFGTNLIVLPEWKSVGDVTTYDNSKGIKLITASNRRNPSQCVDSKIHHCNLINNSKCISFFLILVFDYFLFFLVVLPKIQANNANAADALMLDLEGFVSETNATNVFMVKKGIVLTPTVDSCLPGNFLFTSHYHRTFFFLSFFLLGITRKAVIEICNRLSIPIIERRVSLTEFYTADEVFTTGTMGELTPVNEIDGRQIGNDGSTYPGAITKKIQAEYRILTESEGISLPF